MKLEVLHRLRNRQNENSLQSLVDAYETRVLSDGGIVESKSCLKASLKKLDDIGILNDISLLLIPSGSKIGKLHSIIPITGNGDIDFSRSTTARFTTSNGLVESAAINEPRIDFTGGGCGKALFEPQSTSLLAYSEDYLETTLEFATTSAAGVLAPYGSTNAWKVIEDATNNYHLCKIGNGSAVGFTNVSTASVFVKKGERTKVRVYLHHITLNQTAYADYDLNNNTLIGTAGSNVIFDNTTIKVIGNGWVRISVSGHKDVSNYDFGVAISPLNDAGDVSYLGDGTSGLYMWGGNNVVEKYPTSYIPTSGSAVTRTQDLSVTTGLSDQIGSDEGLFLFEAQAFLNGGDGNRQIAISDGTNDNYIYINFHNSANRIETLAIKAGSVLAAKSAFSANQSNRNIIAIRYKTDQYDVWINGASIGILTGMGAFFTANQLNKLQFNSVLGTSHMKAKVNKVILSKTYPTDTQMAGITTL